MLGEILSDQEVKHRKHCYIDYKSINPKQSSEFIMNQGCPCCHEYFKSYP